jgi:hypothetical protein
MSDESVETDTAISEQSERVRALVLQAVEASAELMSRPAVADRWNEPSALPGMTVGALSAHLVRAAGATIAYLDRTDPTAVPEDELLTPVTYFHAAVDSPIHEQIRTVSAGESAIGHEATVAKCNEVAANMRSRFASEPSGRLVGALGGRMLTLDDFCRTRLIEVLLHMDDLAASVDETRPATDPEGPAIVIDITMGIARQLNGDWEVLYGLSRGERQAKPVFPVF